MAAGFISVQLFSQTQKGNWMLGTSFGSAGFSSSNGKTTYSNTATEYNSKGRSLSISAYPFAMYFVNDNVAVGGSFGISFSGSKNDYSNTASANISKNKSNYSGFSFGPVVRGYFGKAGSDGQPWIEGTAAISTSRSNSDNTNTVLPNSSVSDSRSNNWNAGANLGYSHFINSAIAVQYFIGYRHYHYSSDSDYKPNPGAAYSYETVSDNNNINFGVGLQVHLASQGVKK